MTQLKIAINKNMDFVWDYICDIESHVNWMADAVSVTLISGTPNSVGAKYASPTKVGPFYAKDEIEIIKIEKPNYIEVFHVAAVSGYGYFKLNKINENITEFIWEEDLKFPWYMGSIIGKKIAMVLLHNIWRKNLVMLKSNIEST